MSYLDTPYNNLAFKASHNSYASQSSILQILNFDPSNPFQFGCRGVEFDFARHSDASAGRSSGYFQITHDQGGTGEPLANYLSYLLDFHRATPSHDPIFVTLCIKSQDGDITVFPGEMDTYLQTWFDTSLLYSPGVLLNLAPRKDLLGSVQAKGWPTAGSLAGKFILCISGTESWKSFYAQLQPPQRLCFADVDMADDTPNPPISAKSARVIANMHVYTDHYSKWQASVPELHSAGYLIRAWLVNSQELWSKARTTSINMIATDDVQGNTWASVGNAPFVVF